MRIANNKPRNTQRLLARNINNKEKGYQNANQRANHKNERYPCSAFPPTFAWEISLAYIHNNPLDTEKDFVDRISLPPKKTSVESHMFNEGYNQNINEMEVAKPRSHRA